MCGIFFSLARHGHIGPDAGTEKLLRNRGPDSAGQYRTRIPAELVSAEGSSIQLHATFFSTVLSLRGNAIVEQPLKDEESGSVFCWNGEAWSMQGQLDTITGNDSQIVFDLLLQATRASLPGRRNASVERVTSVLSAIRGPYAFVFYDARNQSLFFGRDCLGRRSLLRKSTPAHELVFSSVRSATLGAEWAEVEADGIYMVDLQSSHSTDGAMNVVHVPHRRPDEPKTDELSFVGKFSASLMLAEPASICHFQP
jgi:asparagine synthetase B (glutamine-hydrolysing)